MIYLFEKCSIQPKELVRFRQTKDTKRQGPDLSCCHCRNEGQKTKALSELATGTMKAEKNLHLIWLEVLKFVKRLVDRCKHI